MSENIADMPGPVRTTMLRRLTRPVRSFAERFTGRRASARWAVISGIAGLAAGLFLMLFFGLARPQSGEPSPWSWTGPANDLTSAVQAVALIPVALALRDLMPDRLVRRWTSIGMVAMGAAAVLSVLLVAGLLPFAVQAPLVTACFVVMYSWLFVINRAGLRSGVLPMSVARAGMATSLALAAGAAVAALALPLPGGSTLQYAVFAVAAGFVAVAWLGFPAWTLLLRRVL